MHHLSIINNEIACFDVVEANCSLGARPLEQRRGCVFNIILYLSRSNFFPGISKKKRANVSDKIILGENSLVEFASSSIMGDRLLPEKENGRRRECVAAPAKIIMYSTLTHSHAESKACSFFSNPRARLVFFGRGRDFYILVQLRRLYKTFLYYITRRLRTSKKFSCAGAISIP